MTAQASPTPNNGLPKWEPLHELIDKEGGVGVRIYKRPVPPRTPKDVPLVHYTYEICHFHNGKLHKYFPAFFDINQGRASIRKFPFQAIVKLIQNAETFIETKRQERETVVWDLRVERENEQAAKFARKRQK